MKAIGNLKTNCSFDEMNSGKTRYDAGFPGSRIAWPEEEDTVLDSITHRIVAAPTVLDDHPDATSHPRPHSKGSILLEHHPINRSTTTQKSWIGGLNAAPRLLSPKKERVVIDRVQFLDQAMTTQLIASCSRHTHAATLMGVVVRRNKQ